MGSPNPHRTYEIRCPVHGFIAISDWEKEIIAHPVFQRLRRIRQLALTDLVYPGAMHSRFEHSLGVMHVAKQLYDAVVDRSRELLKSELHYNDDGLNRDRILIGLAALLHDVGHTPFSHAGEELFPIQEDGQTRYEHEHYSAAIIRVHLRSVIEDHPLNQNYQLKAEEIAAFLESSARVGRTSFWRELVSGHMDADRIDYLLRDSLHAGVDYGRFDWRRLLNSVEVAPGAKGRGPRLGVNEGGFHAAEALVLARYFMFTQVYFHKTRIAYDHHLQRALAEALPGGRFPRPIRDATADELSEFLKWDDWRVFGILAGGGGGEHGQRLVRRDHYREVYHTPETPTVDDLTKLDRVRKKLGTLVQAEGRAEKSWYKLDQPDIPVVSDNPGRAVLPLSEYSSVVKGLSPIRKVMLFARKEEVSEGRQLVLHVEGVDK